MKESGAKRLVTRRDLLKAGGVAALGSLLYACSPTATQPTQAPAAPTTAAGAPAPTQAPAASTPAAPAATATPAGAAIKRGGTFTMARTANNANLSGIDLARGNFAFIRALYNTLIQLDSGMNPQPQLAEKWEFSPDGLTMTLKLRHDVKFHSGSDFTSDDVKFSWEFGKDPQTGSPQMRSLFSMIKAVNTPDKYAVELKFEQPMANVFDILDTLCMFDRSMVDKLSTTDAGSGPFKVDKYVPNSEITMKKFDGYWDQGKPYMDGYTVKGIPDASAMVINFESQAVDAIWAPPAQEVARLKQSQGVVADPGAGSQGVFHLMASMKGDGPLSNQKVRQALNYAIDRARCVKNALSDTVPPTCLIWPKGSWAYFEDLEGTYSYNLDKSKQLLAEAGFADGFETSIIFSGKDNPPQFAIAQIIQADLQKLGIKAKLEDTEPTLYNTRIRGGDFELAIHNYGRANRDPATTLSGAIIWYPASEKGPIGFDSADFVKWRDEAAKTLDREKRKPLYRQIQQWSLEQSFSMPIAGNQSFWIYRDYTKGMQYSSESSPYVSDVWLNK
ncbi:MAG: ABC transporter substrate-binding protein [Chloroflexota bacterium]